MAAAAGAPPPGPPQPPPPPPPEESSDSEPEAEPGSPQKLIRKVSTSGQIRQKVSSRRRPGRAPLTPRQPGEARGPAREPPRPGPARPGVPPGAAVRAERASWGNGPGAPPRAGAERVVRAGRRRGPRAGGAGGLLAGPSGWGGAPGPGAPAAGGPRGSPALEGPGGSGGLETGGERTKNGGCWPRPASARSPNPGFCSFLRTDPVISRWVPRRLTCGPLGNPTGLGVWGLFLDSHVFSCP